MINMAKKAFISSLIVTVIASGISGATAANKPVVPVAKNPIVNTSNVAGISITSAMVQDNVDPKTKKAITDRLLIAVVNKGSKSATGFEIFYSMTDSATKATENYYLPLTGFTLKPGATGYLNFDGKTGVGHFPENKFSLYRSSTNEVKFNIQLSAKGYKIAASTAVKDKGTGEKVD
jgi:hypothetical protein